jgi:hypothetical protein
MEENTGESLEDNDFPNRTPKAQEIKARTGPWDCSILKSFCMAINSYRSDSPKSGRNFSQVFI